MNDRERDLYYLNLMMQTLENRDQVSQHSGGPQDPVQFTQSNPIQQLLALSSSTDPIGPILPISSQSVAICQTNLNAFVAAQATQRELTESPSFTAPSFTRLTSRSNSCPTDNQKAIQTTLIEFQEYNTGGPRRLKVFTCKESKKCFTTPSHLKRHMVSHSTDRPFDCSICQRKFSRKDNRDQHVRKMHGRKDTQSNFL